MKALLAKNSIGVLATHEQMEKLEQGPSMILSGGAAKRAMSEIGATARDLHMVEPSKLEVIEGYNPRVHTKKYHEHVEQLVESMLENGFLLDKPLAGYIAKRGDEDVVMIYEGGTRLAAALIAIERGAKFEKIPVIASGSGMNMEDLLVATKRGNDGKSLTAYENGVIVKRLVQAGMDVKTVSKRLGFSPQYTENLLKLMASHHEIRKMVANDEIAATTAIEHINKHGDKALEMLTNMKEAANSAGKTRVTNRFKNNAPMLNIAKKSALPMFEALKVVKSDQNFAALDEKTQEVLSTLLTELEAAQTKAEEKAKAAADKKANPKVKKGRGKKDNVVQMQQAA